MSNFVVNPYMFPIPCVDEDLITNTGTGGGWAINKNTVWVSITTDTVSAGDEISKIACHVSATTNQPYNAKFVCYSDDGGNPDTFICMTQSADLSGSPFLELDVVNASGSVESHTVTASEAGNLWLGSWSADNIYASVQTSVTNGTRQMSAQTYNASNTVEPQSGFSDDVQYTAQIRMRSTVCVY